MHGSLLLEISWEGEDILVSEWKITNLSYDNA